MYVGAPSSGKAFKRGSKAGKKTASHSTPAVMQHNGNETCPRS